MIAKLVLLVLVISLSVTIATAQPQSPDHTLDDTLWLGLSSQGEAFVLEFQKLGTLRLIPQTGIVSTGRWSRHGDSINLTLNKNFLQLTGRMGSDHIDGSASTRTGQKWQWSATKQPSVLEHAAPAFPPIAVAARVNSDVVVDLKIDALGTVISAEAVRGHPLLRKASEDVARRWKFKATQSDGAVRVARLVFGFRVLPVNTDERTVVSPVFLSPYQVVVSRVPSVIY